MKIAQINIIYVMKCNNYRQNLNNMFVEVWIRLANILINVKMLLILHVKNYKDLLYPNKLVLDAKALELNMIKTHRFVML